jgi:hypothetical protein
MQNNIGLKSINELLSIQNLRIPSYQRPYKWSQKNIGELLQDIENAITQGKETLSSNFKYRIGTILLHNNNDTNTQDIVDGQQRIISFCLLSKYLDTKNRTEFIDINLENKITQFNIYSNYAFIKDWFLQKSNDSKELFLNALSNLLEVVVINVTDVSEAFQLFDSQNSRGKELEPHNLLKAYHLREMNGDLFEMKKVAEKWDNIKSSEIKDLFNSFLFPIINWSDRNKTIPFTTNEVDVFKGVKKDTKYPYAQRTYKSMPDFQITEPFIAGKDFFLFVDYYLSLKDYLQNEALQEAAKFDNLLKIRAQYNGTGFEFAKKLFLTVLLCYYDRFKNLDEKTVNKLFTWALMIRIDMMNLGYDTINKYAIGEQGYTNNISMFYNITRVKEHTKVSSEMIKAKRHDDKARREKWNDLYHELKKINGES